MSFVFGKHFAAMYTGSMMGSGAPVFAVWGYVVANMQPDKVVGAQVELNPKLLAAIIGEAEKVVVDAINFLCAPDPNSRTPDEGGRRLVRLGQFDYRVVNGAKYMAIRNAEERREQNRAAQERFREKKSKASKAVKTSEIQPSGISEENGTQDGFVEFPNGDPKEIAIAKEIKGTETPRQQDADARRPMPETIREQWPPKGV